MIKSTYLGGNKPKKRNMSLAVKYKFSFDWNADEDTSVELNPLYANRADVSLMFGRGFVGGVDRREQIKKHQGYLKLVEQNKQAVASTADDTERGDQRDLDRVREREEAKRKKDQLITSQNRHWSEKPLAEMEERDWRIFKEDFSIATRGSNVPHPIRFWHESGMHDVILKTLERVDYKEPTPIQRAALPIGLRNLDVVGIAQTGSGKTVAFVLPMLVYISRLPKLTKETAELGPYAIVLAPTRELATQIEEETRKFASPMGIRCACLVGGENIQDQGFLLGKGAEIVIATPGRMFDCIERRFLVLDQCNYIVLDEADRMIDMNFEQQLLKILECMPSSNLRPENELEEETDKRYRQTIMFSATMPPKVENLARKYLRRPVFVSIGRAGTSSAVTQQVEMLNSEQARRNRLLQIVRDNEPPMMVFCNTKSSCDVLSRYLEQQGIN